MNEPKRVSRLYGSDDGKAVAGGIVVGARVACPAGLAASVVVGGTTVGGVKNE